MLVQSSSTGQSGATTRTGFHDVARGAGDVGDDGALAAAPGVEQAGLADVGAAHQRHPQPPLQQLPLLCRCQRLLQSTWTKMDVIVTCGQVFRK